MGNKVDVMQAIYTRLNAAIASGKPLYGVKRIRIGAVEELRKENDLPIINLRLLSGSEETGFRNGHSIDTMGIEVLLLHSKLAQTGNTLYKTSDSTGALFMLENLLNVLDNTTSGTPDITFGATAGDTPRYDYSIDESNDVIEIRVNVTVKSKLFASGAR